MSSLRISASGLTDTGLVRAANEDSILQRPEICLWAVADGMGGHEGGQYASGVVVERLQETPRLDEHAEALAAIANAIHGANDEIFQAAGEGARMGSTVVALLVSDGQFTCLWAGDSRCYLLRGRSLYQLTRDHTQVQDMVDAGLMTAGEARSHPMSHVLSRAVGVEAELQLEAVRDVVRSGDVFLLCSDGLHGVVSEDEISERLARLPPGAACARLLELAHSRGAPDNVSIVAVACQEATAVSFAS